MSDLVERYVHQVGQYLPRKDRADIEAELKSQIQDQLEDRYGQSPTDDDIVTNIAEYGHPYEVATSYSSEQYLVGPRLYPFMMMVLTRGWVIVPSMILFLIVFSTVTSPEAEPFLDVLVTIVVNATQVTLIFSAVVILIFALIERSNFDSDSADESFDPQNLPEVNHPTAVDRTELIFGIAFGAFALVAFLYFLSIGGLTLHFGTQNPPDLVPVPQLWLALLIATSIIMMIVSWITLRRNRWSVPLFFIEFLLETFGVILLYFVFYQPLLQPILNAVPALNSIPFINNAPEIVAVITAIGTLLSKGSTLISIWNYRGSIPLSFSHQTDN